eukprot:1433177-Rhodomonas_salina.1
MVPAAALALALAPALLSSRLPRLLSLLLLAPALLLLFAPVLAPQLDHPLPVRPCVGRGCGA